MESSLFEVLDCKLRKTVLVNKRFVLVLAHPLK